MSLAMRSPLPGLPVMPPGGGLKATAPWNASKYAARQFYSYEVDLGQGATFAPSAGTVPNIDVTFQTGNDSDFFWTRTCVLALDNTGAATTRLGTQLPTVVLQMADEAAGRQYDNTQPQGALLQFAVTNIQSQSVVPIADVSGTAEIPFILPKVELWEKNSVIRVTFNNEALIGGANGIYSLFHLTFHGIKAFY